MTNVIILKNNVRENWQSYRGIYIPDSWFTHFYFQVSENHQIVLFVDCLQNRKQSFHRCPFLEIIVVLSHLLINLSKPKLKWVEFAVLSSLFINFQNQSWNERICSIIILVQKFSKPNLKWVEFAVLSSLVINFQNPTWNG